MKYRYIQDIKVREIPKVSLVKYHSHEPPPYPKVSDGYEKLADAIFTTQINNMFVELTKEMVKMKSK